MMDAGQLLDLERLREELLVLIKAHAKLPADRGRAKPGTRRQLRRERRILLLRRRDKEQEIIRFILALEVS